MRNRALCPLVVGLLVTAIGCEQARKGPKPDCALTESSSAYEKVETACDGIDNDCDGATDVLLPVAANRCTTEAKGACHFGFAHCEQKSRRCIAPFATVESKDGVDNDCDGVIDDVVAGVDQPVRARLMVAPVVLQQNPALMKAAKLAMEQLGFPYDINETAAGWETGFNRLDEYSLVIVVGYISGSLTPQHLEKLRPWVARGHVLVLSKPLKAAGQEHLFEFAGIKSEKRRESIDRIEFLPSPLATWLDSPEERSVPYSSGQTTAPAHLYLPVDSPSVRRVAIGREAGKDRGAAAIRKQVGHGSVYSLGFDFLGFHASRCYVNCFDPGRDLFGLMMLGALNESAKGHYVLEHTVPGPEPSVFVASHDIDAPDAFWSGEWGQPGAIRMAQMERAEGVEASYFITTDFVTGYWRPQLVRELCHLGNCPEGGHSVQHFYWGKFPIGECDIKRADYDPAKPTICGEVVLNVKELILAAGKKKLAFDGWRTPYLENHPQQFEILAAAGVKWDSSVAIGDVRTNLPFINKRFPYHQQDLFRGQDMVHFPVVLEDGIGWYEDGVEKRLELHGGTWPNFRSRWTNALVRNAGNLAWTVLLVHPSIGIGAGVGPENIEVKVSSVQYAIQTAKALGLRIERISSLGPFWRGRRAARVEARYKEGSGYVGKIHTGAEPAPRYTLSFGDRVGLFSCPEAGPHKVVGKRVTFQKPLLPNRIYHFTAKVW